MDYGDCIWGLYWNYYRDPFPHSLLSTRETITQSWKQSDRERLPKVPKDHPFCGVLGA